MKPIKLLITGGHPTPALAVIDYLQSQNLDTSILFVGRRYVNSREHEDSFEYTEVMSRHIPFIHFSAERKLRGLIELPKKLVRALNIIRQEKPDRVLSFGGYVSVPICLAAHILHIPVFLHEQTLRPGVANVWIGKVSKKIMVTFPQTTSYFDKRKVVVTGNPVREAILHASYGGEFKQLRRPILFINGGNLGSHSINTHIYALLPELLTQFSVIHQVGNIQEYDDWEKAEETKAKLPTGLRDQYVIKQHLSTVEMGQALRQATIIVSRSGANTTMELIALHKPAVLIPLPWSARGEQQAQAQLLADAGTAEIFDQYESSDQLLVCIQKVADRVQSYIDHYESLDKFHQPKAAEYIAKTVLPSHSDT